MVDELTGFAHHIMRMVLQHFDRAFSELNWSSEYERQTLLVVWIVVIHIVHAGAVVPALIAQQYIELSVV